MSPMVQEENNLSLCNLVQKKKFKNFCKNIFQFEKYVENLHQKQNEV